MNRIFFYLFLGAAGIAVLLYLGFWQLQRLEWKDNLLGAIEARMQEAPSALPIAPNIHEHQYQNVKLSGTLTGEASYVLTSRKLIGPGHQVVAVLKTDTGRVLVDLGFQKDAMRDVVSDIKIDIIGNLYWPNEVDPKFTPDPDLKKNLFFARDLDKLSVHLKTEPILIIANTLSKDLDTMPERIAHNIPNDHLQYAITWFSLALVWAFMTAYAVFYDRKKLT